MHNDPQREYVYVAGIGYHRSQQTGLGHSYFFMKTLIGTESVRTREDILHNSSNSLNIKNVPENFIGLNYSKMRV